MSKKDFIDWALIDANFYPMPTKGDAMRQPAAETRTYPVVWGSSIVTEKCGCKCIAASDRPARVTFCALHLRAGAMRDALEHARWAIEAAGPYLPDGSNAAVLCQATQRAILRACERG